ncbi:hypothetical protein ACIBL3_41075 [Kribbella sp. NPDC050124]|uniref:hypothetical protein n=1 Tax=Kribbella sp. NPDC050124 TaxID=3364114 RepID=UPI00379AFDBC
MGSDLTAWIGALASAATAWAAATWSSAQPWLASVPVGAVFGLTVTDQVALLLPNLM